MVKKSFDAIYKSASKLVGASHSIMLSRRAAPGKSRAALPRAASQGKAAPKERG
jgi:hypothetical protein